MASRFRVGAGGNWSDTAHWSTSTGGATGASAPTLSDDAFFDGGASGSVTLDVNPNCLSFDSKGFTGTIVINGKSWGIAGSFKAVATLVINNSVGGHFNFSASSGAWNITSAGLTIPSVTLTSSGTASWTLQDGLTTPAVDFQSGTFNTNGKSGSWGSFFSSYSNTRTLTLGASAITITGGGVAWNTNNTTGLTMTANTAVVTLSGASVTTNTPSTLNLNGMSWVFSGGGSMFMGNGTVKNVTVTGTAARGDSWGFGSTCTITGQFLATGNNASTFRLLVKTSTPGIAVTLTVNGSHGAHANVDFQDVTIAGTAGTLTGTSIGDCGGNTNITVTAGLNMNCTKTVSFNFSDPTAWSGGRSPLPQDNLTIATVFSAAQTITVDLIRAGRSIDFSGCSGNPTVNYGGFGFIVANYGSLIFGNAVTCGSGNSPGPAGRNGTFFLTSDSAGKLGPNASIFMTAPGATYKFTKDTSFSSQVGLSAGILDGNGQSITAATMNLGGAVSTVGVGITWGSGNWTLTGTGTIVDFTSVANATMTPGTGAIVISDTSSTAKTFAGNSYSYCELRHAVAGTAGLSITGNNTFTAWTFLNSSSRTVTLPANGVQTVTGAVTLLPSGGSALNFVSSTPGQQTTLIVTGATVTVAGYSHSADFVVVGSSQPGSPAGLTATGAHAIRLSWADSVSEWPVSTYKVYRNGLLLGSTATDTYTDNAPPAGFTSVTYSVSAVNEWNVEGAQTSITTTAVVPYTLVRPRAGGEEVQGGRVHTTTGNWGNDSSGQQVQWERSQGTFTTGYDTSAMPRGK